MERSTSRHARSTGHQDSFRRRWYAAFYRSSALFHLRRPHLAMKTLIFFILLLAATTLRAEILAGVAQIDITDRTGPVNDPCFAKALVLKSGETTPCSSLSMRWRLAGSVASGTAFWQMCGVNSNAISAFPPASVVINASHCHGIIRADTQQLVVQVVKEARRTGAGESQVPEWAANVASAKTAGS
jgi:hypothetical protein